MTRKSTDGEQFYKLTLENAVNDYSTGLLTAKGAIAAWVRINLKTGWKRTIKPQEMRELFRRNDKPMPRSTFWDALHKLSEDGVIQFDEPAELEITRIEKRNDIPSNKPDVSKKPDSHPKNRTDIQKTGQPSKKPDERPPEPATSNSSSESPDSYQIYSDLDQRERESEIDFSEKRDQAIDWYERLEVSDREQFDKFCKRRAESLPKAPGMFQLWKTRQLSNLKLEWEKSYRSKATVIDVGTSSAAAKNPQKKFSPELQAAIDNGTVKLSSVPGWLEIVATKSVVPIANWQYMVNR